MTGNPDQRKITIGRDPTCGLVMADDSISRVHAELIVLKGGRLFLTDRRSKNGTRIIRNGKDIIVRQEWVYKDDVLQFGDIKMPVTELIAALSLSPEPTEWRSGPGTPQPLKPWVRGERLVRCECGAVKQKNGRCKECGR